MTPTQRTLKYLREEMGCHRCGIVEKWNSYAGIRQDLFGIIDIIALHHKRGVIGIQSAGTSHSAHLRKMVSDHRDDCKDWLTTPGSTLFLISWRKLRVKKQDGRLSKVSRYEPRVQEITLKDLPVHSMGQFEERYLPAKKESEEK